jgi:hypothetical protein
VLLVAAKLFDVQPHLWHEPSIAPGNQRVTQLGLAPGEEY